MNNGLASLSLLFTMVLHLIEYYTDRYTGMEVTQPRHLVPAPRFKFMIYAATIKAHPGGPLTVNRVADTFLSVGFLVCHPILTNRTSIPTGCSTRTTLSMGYLFMAVGLSQSRIL